MRISLQKWIPSLLRRDLFPSTPSNLRTNKTPSQRGSQRRPISSNGLFQYGEVSIRLPANSLRVEEILICAIHAAIDLANTIPKLDSTASDIVAGQRDAVVQRKDLAQKTKEFRKLDDNAKLTEYKGLLKGTCYSG